MKDFLCNKLLNNDSFKGLSKRLAGELHNDLIQEVALVICEKDERELKKINDYFNFWVVRTMFNMSSRSVMSKYDQKPIEPHNLIQFDYDHEKDKMLEAIDCELKSMYWYDRDLFLLYFEEGSLRNVEKRTGIKYGSVNKTVTKVREHLKDKLI